MKRGGYRRVLMGTVLLAVSSGLWAAEHYKVVNGPNNFYYGHISYIEATPEGKDPFVLREGRIDPEQAVLNLPVGPGDRIRTSADRRCEIQFDTGTVVRLDFSTELRVETILARSLSSLQEMSNLSLERGRIYVMYRAYDGREIFQLLTPSAAIKMKHNAVAIIAAAADGSTETQMKFGKARALFGANAQLLEDREVKKGERLIVRKDSQFELAPSIEGTPFELWNKDVNAHFEALHEGLTVLPKPIQRLPAAVFYFAQTYGSLYGEWLWDDFYGYVWRPFLDNGMYPWGWRPYYYGQWSSTGGQMFWVPQEPWGWIPYHLGIWQWDKKHGWIWLPGSLFAPAWATWDFFFGYACWRPWGLYDWMNGPYSYYGFGFNYLDGVWGYNWPYKGGGPGKAWQRQSNAIEKDQIKRPVAAAFPVPSELKGVLKNVTGAYERGDARIRDSASAVPGHLVFVAKGDLRARAVNEKAVAWDQVAKSAVPLGDESGVLGRAADPRREAAGIFRGGEMPAANPRERENPAARTIVGKDFIAVPLASERPAAPVRRAGGSRPQTESRGPAAAARTENGPAKRDSGPAVRFRDWNPDVRIAREMGVHIEYSSQKNEIRCPELSISSRDRVRGSGLVPNLTSRGVIYGPAGSASRGGVGSTGSSGAAVSSGAGGNSGRSSAGSTGSGAKATKGDRGGTVRS